MLSIGNVNVHSRLVLAPMAGISDLAYRLINRSLGCKLAFTEMLSANALAYRNESTINRLTVHQQDRPLVVQIMGRDLDIIQQALNTLSEYSFDILDFNAACPVKKVSSKGKGAGLLKEPEKLEEILRLLVQNSKVPVTVKIRSGWDETSVNAVEIALRAQDSGVSGVIIHGRTRMQRYGGKVDYNIIRKVKETLSIPVIASGDAHSPELIKKLFDETGCDGVALARGALGNPWIFPETEALLHGGEIPSRPDAAEIASVMKKHLDLCVEFEGERVAILRFRKFFSWYTRGMPARKLKVQAFRAATRDEMAELIDDLPALASRYHSRGRETIKTLPVDSLNP